MPKREEGTQKGRENKSLRGRGKSDDQKDN